MATTPKAFTPAVEAKAAEIVAAGGVTRADGRGYPTWLVRGEHGRYTVRWLVQRKLWECDCPANGAQCSHIRAAQLKMALTEQTTQAKPEAKANKPQPAAVAPPRQTDIKETESMATDKPETQMVRTATTQAMTPQVAPPLPELDYLDRLWWVSEKLAKSAGFAKKFKKYDPATKAEKWFTEPGEPADIFAIILAGLDFGLSPSSASRHLRMVGTAMSISAEIMRARLHQFGYEYDLEVSKEIVDFSLFNKQGSVAGQGKSPSYVTAILWRREDPGQKWSATYNIEEAVKGGLTMAYGGYQKNPEDMLIARATTRVVRRYAPEVLNKTYLPEELGYEEQPDGEEGTRLVRIEVDGEEVPTAAPATPSPPKPRARAKKAPVAPPTEPVGPDTIEGVFDASGAPTGTVERLEDLAEGDEPDGDTPAAPAAANEDGVTDLEIVPEDQPWFQYGPTGGPANEQMKLYMVEQELWEAEDALDLPEEEDDDAGEAEGAGVAGDDDPLALTEEEAALCATGTAGDISKWIGEHKGELGDANRDALKEAAGHGDKTWAEVQKSEHREEIFTMILVVAKAKMAEAKSG